MHHNATNKFKKEIDTTPLDKLPDLISTIRYVDRTTNTFKKAEKLKKDMLEQLQGAPNIAQSDKVKLSSEERKVL